MIECKIVRVYCVTRLYDYRTLTLTNWYLKNNIFAVQKSELKRTLSTSISKSFKNATRNINKR